MTFTSNATGKVTVGVPLVGDPGPAGSGPNGATKNGPASLLQFGGGPAIAVNDAASMFVDLHLVASNQDVSALLMQVLMLALKENQEKKRTDTAMGNANYKSGMENVWHEKDVADSAANMRALSEFLSGFMEMAGGAISFLGAIKSSAHLKESFAKGEYAKAAQENLAKKNEEIDTLQGEIAGIDNQLATNPGNASLTQQRVTKQAMLDEHQRTLPAQTAATKFWVDTWKQGAEHSTLMSRVVGEFYKSAATFLGGVGKSAAAGANLKAGLLTAEGQMLHGRGEMVQLQMNQAYEAGRQAGESFSTILSILKDVMSNTQQTANSIVHAAG